MNTNELLNQITQQAERDHDTVGPVWNRLRNGWYGYDQKICYNLPAFPSVSLDFVDPLLYETAKDPSIGIPWFSLNVTVKGENAHASAPTAFVGVGTTFATALADLLSGIQTRSPFGTVWKGMFFSDVRDNVLVQMLNGHPVFSGHLKECIRVTSRLDLDYPWPQPVWLVEAALWREQSLLCYEKFLRASAPSLSGAVHLLADRFFRVFDDDTEIVTAQDLYAAHKVLCEAGVYTKLSFAIRPDGKITAQREASDVDMIEAASYELLLIKLADTVRKETGR